MPRLAILPLLLCACGVRTMAAPEEGSDYLRYVSFETAGRVHKLLRWDERDLPLAVHLPAPAEDLFADPVRVREVTREAILAWTDAAGPGVPSFRFVDDPGEADIPIVWADEATNISIAFCSYAIDPRLERFRVEHVVVSGRYRDGRPAPHDELRRTVTHEMGHALGLGGHSPNPEDLMYPFAVQHRGGISERDRETLRRLYAQPIGRIVTNPRQVRGH